MLIMQHRDYRKEDDQQRGERQRRFERFTDALLVRDPVECGRQDDDRESDAPTSARCNPRATNRKTAVSACTISIATSRGVRFCACSRSYVVSTSRTLAGSCTPKPNHRSFSTANR